MSSLNKSQKELIFDYCIGLVTAEEAKEAERLIATDKKAAHINENFTHSLKALDHFEEELCPEHLGESTISLLANAANGSQVLLTELLADEQSKSDTAKQRAWRNWLEPLAMAAVILFAAFIYVPVSGSMRQRARQIQCQSGLGQISRGISNYGLEHDGVLPAVKVKAGSPWWKVGYTGQENYSNTRPVWLLVKNDYVSLDGFRCPGKKQVKVEQLSPSKILSLRDFPNRNYLNYSFRIKCSKGVEKAKRQVGRKVLMADLNPIFENLPKDFDSEPNFSLSDAQMSVNSSNHGSKGQNIMVSDGHIKFAKKRRYGVDADDIFTLADIKVYRGSEWPSCETDTFLVP